MLVQLQMLNLILSSKNFRLILDNGLTVDYFPNFRNEFNFIYNHFKTYNQVPDLETFIKVFPDFEVLQVDESVDYIIEELFRGKNENFLADTFNKIRDLLINGKTDEAMSLLSKSANEASESKHMDAVDILSDTSRYEEYLDKCSNLSNYYVSTGFKELDDILGGWDRKNEYSTIIARSGQGKSWCLLKSVVAAANRGLRVGLYSGEIELNKVSYRIDTLMSHISNTKIIRGNIDVGLQYKNYLENLKDNHKGNIFVLTPDMINEDPTVDTLISFVEKYSLDILFIDQQTLLTDRNKARTSFEKAANISKDIKMLQVRKHIPIITVTQQNRTSVEENSFAGTEHIGQSDRIGQDSTTIIGVSQKDGIMTLHIVKARDGGTGKTLNYSIDLDTGMFEYIKEEEEIDEEISSDSGFNPMNIQYGEEWDSDDLPFK